MGEFSKDDRLELVHVDGRPSHFREKPHKGDDVAISEATASYLQDARPISASQYVSRAMKPISASLLPPSPSEISLFSSDVSVEDSAATTPEIQSTHSFSPIESRLGIVVEKVLSSATLPKQTNGIASTPYGRRLIPQIMDSLAATEPERIVFSLTTLSGNSLEFRRISAHAFTKAVDKTAWWLQNQVGNCDSIQPVAYIGPRKLNREHREY
jgi:hypothetical protein